MFAKLEGSPAGAERFAAELRGLSLIRSRTDVATPVPVAGGIVAASGGTLLLYEALPERGDLAGQAADSRTPGDYAAIGRALAGLHQVRGEAFGLAEFDGFFGPLPQSNRPVGSGRWADFYAERRVLPMLRLAIDSGFLPAGLARAVDRVAARLPALCGPDPVPALLHGDAQQNNFVSTADGAVVIDVAPYFGHPEADLALVESFPRRTRRCCARTRSSRRSTPGSPGGASCGGCTCTSGRSRSAAEPTWGARSCPASPPPWGTTRNTDNSKKRSRRKSPARVIPRGTVTIKS